MMAKSFFKKLTTKVPAPKSRGQVAHVFGRQAPLGKKAVTSRIYSKGIAKTDPTQFMDFGFGRTGMDGEN